jgi:polyisoprenoid-binding protein YceI
MSAIATLSLAAAVGAALAASASRGAAGGEAGELPSPGTYTLDPPHTFVYFNVRHKVVGLVRGRFDKASGTVVVTKAPADCSVEVSIDASSLSTQNPIRDADVKGPDFFDAAKFPAITYKGRGIHKQGREWVLDGALTIRGVTRTVPLHFRFNGVAPGQPGKPQRLGFHATAATQRAQFNMTRELLDEIGKANAPDVWIEIDTEALSGPPASRGPGGAGGVVRSAAPLSRRGTPDTLAGCLSKAARW